MDFHSSMKAVRKNWWIITGLAAVAALVGIVVTASSPAQYSSSVTFFVRTPAEQINGAYQGDQFAQKRVNSYVQLAESQRLAELVRVDTQSDLTADQISREITARGDLNTVLLTLTVTDGNPQRSLEIANSLSTQFVELVSQLETPPGATSPSVSLEVTSAASLNPNPVSPRPILNLAIALIVGLSLGISLAVAREMLDNSIRSTQAIKGATDKPLLAVIPFDQSAKASPLIVQSHSQSIRAESFRQLRTNLQFVDVDNPVKVLVVTSSLPDEGKSSTAANLAVAFAESGRRVLLIEADLRRPRVAQYLGLEGAIGLTNILAGQVEIDEVLQSWGRGGLTVLPSGSVPPNPSELLDSQNMRELIASLRDTFEFIVIDTPPLLPVTDAAIVTAVSDGALLVVRHGKTTVSQLSAAAGALTAVGGKLFGIVLNRAPAKGAESYGYGGYGYTSVSVSRNSDETSGGAPYSARIDGAKDVGSQESGLTPSR